MFFLFDGFPYINCFFYKWLYFLIVQGWDTIIIRLLLIRTRGRRKIVFHEIPQLFNSTRGKTIIIRLLFIRTRGRHNSWHNLTQTQDEPASRKRQSSSHINFISHPTSPRAPSPSPAIKELLHRQEIYIEQLEKEASFCKEQLSTILTQVQSWSQNFNISNKCSMIFK